MSDINKSIELYELIIERLKKSGNAPNQLAAYEGSLECIKGCATAEEAMDALEASPWYTTVAQGLVLDDLEAKQKAMAEQGMDDVAAAYETKLEEVRKDYLKAWDTAYVTQIQQLVKAHTDAKEQEVSERMKTIEDTVKGLENSDVDGTELATEWAEISKHKSEIIEIGKKELAKLSRASATCTAPADRTGKYSFECTAKEVF